MEEKIIEEYKVELMDDSNKKETVKQPGNVLALLSMIFAFVALACGLINLLLGLVTVVLTLAFGSIIPIIHIVFCAIPLVFGILAIVFSRISKKKGNTSTFMKLGFIFGLISTILLGIIIVLLLVLFVLAFVLGVLALILNIILSFIGSALTTVIPALTPILAILVPVAGAIFADLLGDVIHELSTAILPYAVEYLIEWFESLVSGGIMLPLIW